MTPEDALRRVLEVEGLGVPRVLVAERAREFAQRVREGGGEQRRGDLENAVEAASSRIWPDMRHSLDARLRRAAATRPPDEDEAFMTALEWTASEDSDNPLALAVVARSAAALGAAMDRTQERLRAIEIQAEEGGPQAALAIAGAVGESVVDLLDLDVEDYEPELVVYVDHDQTPEALDTLARNTDDPELRAVVREMLLDLLPTDAPAASAAVSQMAEGAPPVDPSDDALWMPAMLALAEEAISIALAAELNEQSPGR